ncbi:hypothetical protein BDF20DRAFT_839037 [Mycotypha africana]|uniref:uncharacterized protein n=1 Tax=Mycotypha africana TaxID=64632 RepID=UPI002301FD88|nr:uncharacterized protein BDF20DRAFT_839037 [Mycotypha africana]KAI8969077.1 hypothetical protein BDF20DRAFT_839037 [Mycotypha africana]
MTEMTVQKQIFTKQADEKMKRRLQAMPPTMRARQLNVLHFQEFTNDYRTKQSQFLSAGISGYIVLFADFGPEKNCYTPIREWFQNKKKRFWSLSEEEKNELKEQGKLHNGN